MKFLLLSKAVCVHLSHFHLFTGALFFTDIFRGMTNKNFCYLELLITPQLSFYEAVETEQ